MRWGKLSEVEIEQIGETDETRQCGKRRKVRSIVTKPDISNWLDSNAARKQISKNLTQV